MFSMQSVLPTNVDIKYWGFTVLVLFLITTLLVINLPHITTFLQFLRDWQDRYWRQLWDTVWNKKLALKEEDEESGVESGDDEYEMDEMEGNEMAGGLGGEVWGGFQQGNKVDPTPSSCVRYVRCPVRLSQPTDSDTRFAQQSPTGAKCTKSFYSILIRLTGVIYEYRFDSWKGECLFASK